MTEPILPKEWYGQTVQIASLNEDVENGRGTLLEANAIGVTIRSADDGTIEFYPWTNVWTVWAE